MNCALLSSAGLTFDGTIGAVGIDGTLLSGRAGATTITLPATFTSTRRFRIVYSAIVAFAGATASGAGLPLASGVAIDALGYLRDATTPDAGPFEFGGSTQPADPDLGGGGGEGVAWRFMGMGASIGV